MTGAEIILAGLFLVVLALGEWRNHRLSRQNEHAANLMHAEHVKALGMVDASRAREIDLSKRLGVLERTDTIDETLRGFRDKLDATHQIVVSAGRRAGITEE